MSFISFSQLDRERPVKDVPLVVKLVLAGGLLIQMFWHYHRPVSIPEASTLPAPVSQRTLQISSFGEPAALARLLMLWLQAFDHQPGISIPFKELDYSRVIAWLEQIMLLDERSYYPLLSASRVYSEVPDDEKKRQILEFVYQQFLEQPNHRWPWLAHAVFVAKHKLKDFDLAYKFASALRLYAADESIPKWAKQMEIFILEEQGEIEEAKILIGGLLESGVITDLNELKFLEERLQMSVDDFANSEN